MKILSFIGLGLGAIAISLAIYLHFVVVPEANAAETTIEMHDAIMLAYHGSLTVGPDVWTAYLRLESLEHTAKILYMVQQLGGGEALPPNQVQKLFDLRQKIGLGRPGDNERYCEHCGVCHPTNTHIYQSNSVPNNNEIEQQMRQRVDKVVRDVLNRYTAD